MNNNNDSIHWAFFVGIFGLLFALGETIKYSLFYPDWDKLIRDVIIGLGVYGWSIVYRRQLNIKQQIEGLEDVLSNKS